MAEEQAPTAMYHTISDSDSASRDSDFNTSPCLFKSDQSSANDLSFCATAKCKKRKLNNDSPDSAKPLNSTTGNLYNQGSSKLQCKSPYSFYLTTVCGIDKEYNNYLAISIKDILSPTVGRLRCSVQFNYMIDFDWLIEQYPAEFRNKPMLLVCGASRDGNADLTSSITQYSNVQLCQAKLEIAYGTHHTKMMLLLYDEGLRVVIHTANLIQRDWYQKTQGVWMSPLCPQISADQNGESPTGFKKDLIDYLIAYRKIHLETWVEQIKLYDFSSIRVFLVASVPGRHVGPQKSSWGHMKLRSVLQSNGPCNGNIRSWPVLAQFSSIGSLGQAAESWLKGEFLSSLGTTLAPMQNCSSSVIDALSSKCQLQLIFPTKECVRLSLEGYPAGGAIPYSIGVAKRQPYVQYLMHHWKSNGRGRTFASPHIKSYIRYCPQSGQAAWFILTSANLSKAAWGSLEKSQSQLMIRSYEMGVLFLPKFFITEDTFSISTYLAKLKESPEIFPLPYDLPPVKYSKTDQPWIWDIPYTDLPDSHGNTWCPS